MTAAFAPLREAERDPFGDLCNIEAEQALLGAILVNNQAFEHVADIVASGDFTQPVHGRMFAAIAERIATGMRADLLTMRDQFERDQALAGLGGTRYLAALIERVVTITGAPSYARTIADLARRRDVVMAAQDIIADAAAVDGERSATTVIDDAEQRLYDIAERGSQQGAPRALSDILAGTIGDIEAAYRRGGAITVDTGLEAVDRIIAGIGAGDLIVLAGRPAMGKSACAGTIAANCARDGKHVLFFSLEMSRAELGQRWIAGDTGITTEAQRHGRLDALEWTRLIDAQTRLGKLPIMVDDQARLSVNQMRQRARRVKRRTGLDLIVIDHLQLIRQSGKQESRRLEIGDATSMLKSVAKELQVPVLLLSQLSRGVESRDDKRPTLSDLKESGDIEQDADVVMFLYREEYYLSRTAPRRRGQQTADALATEEADWRAQTEASRGLADIIVAKNRHGRTGVAKLAFDGERQRFENLAHWNS